MKLILLFHFYPVTLSKVKKKSYPSWIALKNTMLRWFADYKEECLMASIAALRSCLL